MNSGVCDEPQEGRREPVRFQLRHPWDYEAVRQKLPLGRHSSRGQSCVGHPIDKSISGHPVDSLFGDTV